MTQINWGILDPNAVSNAGLAVRQGMEIGQQFRRDSETSKALGVLAMDPMNQQATAELARWNPELGYRVAGDQRKQIQDAHRTELLKRAYQGDKEATAEAFGFDPDLVLKMDEGTKKQLKQSVDFISNAALQIDRMPEQDRAGAWAQYVQLAESRGMDIPTEYERYSPQVLQSAIAEAGAMSKLLEAREPHYQVIPEGGTLVNTRDPQALAQVGATSRSGPQPGAVEDGYRFKGGNPADPQSWEPVGDAPPPAPSPDQAAATVIGYDPRANVVTPQEFRQLVAAMGSEQAARQYLGRQGLTVEGQR